MMVSLSQCYCYVIASTYNAGGDRDEHNKCLTVI